MIRHELPRQWTTSSNVPRRTSCCLCMRNNESSSFYTDRIKHPQDYHRWQGSYWISTSSSEANHGHDSNERRGGLSRPGDDASKKSTNSITLNFSNAHLTFYAGFCRSLKSLTKVQTSSALQYKEGQKICAASYAYPNHFCCMDFVVADLLLHLRCWLSYLLDCLCSGLKILH